MKIIFYTHVYPDEHGFLGGIFIHNQAIALKKAGHDVCVCVIDFRSIRKKRKLFKYKYILDDIVIYRNAIPLSPLNRLIGITADRLTDKTLSWIVSDFGKPDIIYAHFGEYAYYVKDYCRRNSIPYAVTEHASSILTNRLSDIQRQHLSNAYDNASVVIAVSKALKEKMSPLTCNNIEVIPNIIPDYMFEIGKANEKADHSDFLFISVGNLIKRKSFDITIQAFDKVTKDNPNVRLLIVGQGPEDAYLKNLAKQLGVDDRTEFLGQLDNHELAKTLRKCDCFVLPSKFETFGVVYIEAMACGLPVIATRCGGPEDFVNESNGVLCEVDDVEGIAEAMRYMYGSKKNYLKKCLNRFAFNLCSEKVFLNKVNLIIRKISIGAN